MDKQAVLNSIYDAIDEFQKFQTNHYKLEKSPEARVFGKNGALDSLGLVAFIVAVEQKLEENLNVQVTLADEKAMSQAHSPFRTLDSLATYATQLLQDPAR